ncbi:MAG: 30S ribosomal protein S16 [Chloroflexi bacterium AL-W]|nr:30S ribosomal protein S16 [Chloroflexi bacterium AL-N1]NOK67667.1 30S ribosomal protein S16 [Chloroflexi bacterium AL-N10]NOK75563.1 30S ribosomal protein S16 [Chloroflexi bacterium AL-N5]NOK82351.1 30S ribosomal protein S16 [Chloroflexi bacterium AL-W]NOK90196.1 30S ribosomal protein S16 [Chloroflexi bacterium AL-N15]
MVRIRLRRTGKTKQPSYRLVIADSRAPRDGRFIEIIGHYNPVRQPKELVVKEDRARYWLSVGAQPSDTVVRLLKQVNVLDANGEVMGASEEATTGSVESAPVVTETPVADEDAEAVVSEQPTTAS